VVLGAEAVKRSTSLADGKLLVAGLRATSLADAGGASTETGAGGRGARIQPAATQQAAARATRYPVGRKAIATKYRRIAPGGQAAPDDRRSLRSPLRMLLLAL
jgi:hypothetical protein